MFVAVAYCGMSSCFVYSMEKEIVEKEIEEKHKEKTEGLEENKKQLQKNALKLLKSLFDPECLACMYFVGILPDLLNAINETFPELLTTKEQKKIISSLSMEELETLYSILFEYTGTCLNFLNKETTPESPKKRDFIIQIMANIITEWRIGNLPQFLQFSKNHCYQKLYDLSSRQLELINEISLEYTRLNIGYMNNSYFDDKSYYAWFRENLDEQLSENLKENTVIFDLSEKDLKTVYRILCYYAHSPKNPIQKINWVTMPNAQELEKSLTTTGFGDFLKRTDTIKFLAGKRGSIAGIMSVIRLLIKEYVDTYKLPPQESILKQQKCRKIADFILGCMLRDLPATKSDVKKFLAFEEKHNL